MIQEYVGKKYGFKVHTAYIAEVKRYLGLTMYDAPNAVEELKQPRKHPPKENIEAITEALRYFGGNLIDERIYQIAEQIVQLHQKAYEVYLPLVEDVCSRTVLEDELSYLLDYLLDFACDEKILKLFKRVCRKYLYIYPSCIKLYVEAYREMWEDEDSYSVEYS